MVNPQMIFRANRDAMRIEASIRRVAGFWGLAEQREMAVQPTRGGSMTGSRYTPSWSQETARQRVEFNRL